MAQIAPFLMTAATGMQALGAVQEGRAGRKAAERNAQIAERNATITRQQANADALAQQKEARKKLGAIRAGYGASGLTMEGSPLDILEESASNAELDRRTILYKGELRALGYEDEAALERMRGKQSETSGYLRAGTALLKGGAAVAGSGLFESSTPTAPTGMYNGGTGTNPTTGLRYGGV